MTVIERVKGWVLGMPLTVAVIHGEDERVRVRERVRETLTERVNGCVLGIGVLEPVSEILVVARNEAGTVGTEGGDEETVIDLV